MNKWSGKIAVVTGASAGIGAAIAVELAKHNITVVGLARRKDRIEALAKENKNLPGKIHAVECDVTKAESITAAFDWVEKKLGGVDILVNNAGTYRKANALDLDVPDDSLTLTIETNFTGLLLCTRRAFKTMQNRPLGYIININSIAGHMTANALPPAFGLNIYGATKHAVTNTTEVFRMELATADNRKIRVSVSFSNIYSRPYTQNSYGTPLIKDRVPQAGI